MSLIQDLKNDLAKHRKRIKEIDDRVKSLEVIHHDVVLVERVDLAKLSTFLSVDPMADKDRIKKSWVGRILFVQEVHDDNDPYEVIIKGKLKLGTYVLFNPDTAYSLNIKDFPEIWVISVSNALAIDNAFSPINMLEEHIAEAEKIDKSRSGKLG